MRRGAECDERVQFWSGGLENKLAERFDEVVLSSMKIL
jgi:hypothetical protein